MSQICQDRKHGLFHECVAVEPLPFLDPSAKLGTTRLQPINILDSLMSSRIETSLIG